MIFQFFIYGSPGTLKSHPVQNTKHCHFFKDLVFGNVIRDRKRLVPGGPFLVTVFPKTRLVSKVLMLGHFIGHF